MIVFVQCTLLKSQIKMSLETHNIQLYKGKENRTLSENMEKISSLRLI